ASMGSRTAKPHAATPHAAKPHAAKPHAAKPHAAKPHAATPHATGTHAPAQNTWRAIGAAMREIELLIALAREAHYGSARAPLDELDGAKAEPGMLAKPPWPDAVAELIRARHTSLCNVIAHAVAEIDREQQPVVRGLLVWVGLGWRSSRRAQRALPDR